MSDIKNITCPNCAHQFDVEEVLANKLEVEYKQKLELQRKTLQDQFAERQKDLEEAQMEFEEKKKRENEIFQERLDLAVATKQTQLKTKIREDFELKIKAQEEELEAKRKKVIELQEKEIEIQRLKNRMNEQEKDIELKYEKKLGHLLLEKEEILQKRITEENELKNAELKKKLADQRALIEEMRRKDQQGSMQLQGEVQELAIEAYIKSEFPLDGIEEIKKGVRGGDCLQTIHTHTRKNCGTIYYESKRTKDFQPVWIEKFKTDMRNRGADIGVIVTQAMPKGMDRMGQKEGIWICSFNEFKSLSKVLRQTIILVNEASASQENKGDKMEMLYGYLTSNEFKMQIEGIVDGFSKMQEALNKEKNAMYRIWNEREKQLNKVILNTTGLYGSIKGIAGNAIGSVQQLELPGGDEFDELGDS